MMSSIYILLIILSVLIASYSQILLKKGAMEKNIYINKYTIIGYSLMLISTLFTLYAYKGVNLSLSQMLQSLSFVFVMIFSYFLLKEKITKKMVIGVLFILLGIIIYSL